MPDQSKLGELDGVSADATGRRCDQDVAGAACAVELGADGLRGLESSEAGHWQPHGVGSGYASGADNRDALGCCYALCEATSFPELQFRHDFVANFELAYFGTYLSNLSGNVGNWNKWKFKREKRT